ncbi:mitochondrial import inner membrane translocase subunit TIM50, putative [Plasmodium gallinaceum]|uniref:Mitochondrial import inner membrane translocase subunit TIM50 n=1 Tax=Plasmodium gallinaceum TaxID=5849 RepID=A0A1J1GQF3_PLAGA|nr:mitochondrial import inner membrane translocase subunit TIM50, putative [Plasmodium gallinaceum]CRG93274.1 mitochondrial import inner membrane translocase subunit TIM50, putative [Plasmodium gallinaceum]
MIKSLRNLVVHEKKIKGVLLRRNYIIKLFNSIDYRNKKINLYRLNKYLDLQNSKNDFMISKVNLFKGMNYPFNKWSENTSNENMLSKKSNISNYNEKMKNHTIIRNNINKIVNVEKSKSSNGINCNKLYVRNFSNISSNKNEQVKEEVLVSNVTKEKELNTTSKNNKTIKQMYIDKKQKEKMIKLYLLLSLILIPFGYTYMYCLQNNITIEDLLKIIKKNIELIETKYNDLLHEFIDKYFPLSNEPLLPDFKDLNYPENLPTLVIDLNYVIAKLEYNRKTGWRVLKRPYADLFFKELSSFYEIVIWSDDNFPVAQEVISRWGIPAIGCLHRDQCSKKKKFYVKDLKRLGRNLDRVVIIDHDSHAFMLQPENGILIKEFHGDVNDKEILCLIDLLKSFAISTYDIRQFLKKYGGGDYNIGKRYLQLKSDTEQKSKRIRNIGKIFHLDNKKTPNGISFNS